MNADIPELIAMMEKMAEALKPFAAVSSTFPFGGGLVYVNLEDCHRARDILKALKG